MTRPTALYVHVPFCASKCAYCDFFSLPSCEAGAALVEAVVDATLERAARLSERFGVEGYESVYVGGGTPSSLPPPLLERLLAGLGRLAPDAAELTVEANPESLTRERLDIMVAAGVTRLSVGVQSLDDGELALMGRPHDAARAEEAIGLAAGSGLALSADLISALPRPKAGRAGRPAGASLADAARRLVGLGAGHLSIYDLVVEEGTRFAAALREGELVEPDEDEAWEMRMGAERALEELGFRRYEVSNYSRPGAESRHNLAYWRMDSYLGAGPGAVSTIGGLEGGSSLRIEESRDARNYPARAAELAVDTSVGPRDSAFEVIMMGFRTRFGLDARRFERRFGRRLEGLVPRSLDAWSERLGPGWGPEGSLALDGRGLDLLNRFLTDCLAELEETWIQYPVA